MSLTSYRAAPPRDKPLHALSKNRMPKRSGQRPGAPINPVRRLPEKTTRANALGCGRYVPTRARFGKGHEASFADFVRGQNEEFGAKTGPMRLPGRKACNRRLWNRKTPPLRRAEAGSRPPGLPAMPGADNNAASGARPRREASRQQKTAVHGNDAAGHVARGT
jgi:hypothetical protein